ncbi:phiSA1p31-related protein [Streptomyces sp. NPDC001941]|uniref:phiSA1p31-related protein n=1 Tax=Streptomyces sp. NPDC001941 TaxID=3154659 RepID=UPI0033221DCE
MSTTISSPPLTSPASFPTGDRRPTPVAGLTPPPVAYVDADGDRWTVTGKRTPDGELIVECAEPQDPDDAGEGESFPWTLRLVEDAFGPLTAVWS